MNKKDAIELLNHEAWTKADAKRALDSLDFKLNSNNIDELSLLRVASQFAGAELYERQKI